MVEICMGKFESPFCSLTRCTFFILSFTYMRIPPPRPVSVSLSTLDRILYPGRLIEELSSSLLVQLSVIKTRSILYLEHKTESSGLFVAPETDLGPMLLMFVRTHETPAFRLKLCENGLDDDDGGGSMFPPETSPLLHSLLSSLSFP